MPPDAAHADIQWVCSYLKHICFRFKLLSTFRLLFSPHKSEGKSSHSSLLHKEEEKTDDHRKVEYIQTRQEEALEGTRMTNASADSDVCKDSSAAEVLAKEREREIGREEDNTIASL